MSKPSARCLAGQSLPAASLRSALKAPVARASGVGRCRCRCAPSTPGGGPSPRPGRGSAPEADDGGTSGCSGSGGLGEQRGPGVWAAGALTGARCAAAAALAAAVVAAGPASALTQAAAQCGTAGAGPEAAAAAAQQPGERAAAGAEHGAGWPSSSSSGPGEGGSGGLLAWLRLVALFPTAAADAGQAAAAFPPGLLAPGSGDAEHASPPSSGLHFQLDRGSGAVSLHPAEGRAGGAGLTGYAASAATDPDPLSELASETEDRLLEVARQVEARVEGLVGALEGRLPGSGAPGAGADGAAAAEPQARQLIQEVWEVVDANYLDARSTGFDRQRWADLRDEALRGRYRDTPGAYRAVRDMLARGLSDPYCRFIGPPELAAMKKYDVSGVGLNLGTAAEYVIKTGYPLPPRDPAAGEGVYVVGVSRGSPADLAGVRQGDELLRIGGAELGPGDTPFQAAGRIAGVVGAPTAAAGGSGGAEGGSGGEGDRGSSLIRVRVRHTDGGVAEVAVPRPARVLPSTVSTSLVRSGGGGGAGGGELVGTVRLGSFNARAQSDVSAAIRSLEAQGATRLVLDLRDNRGGLVNEGLEVARLFLEGGAPIVITERHAGPPDTPRAPGPPLTAAPLLVLVNAHTASASEIVAGALHDNCRAVLAGRQTYGKGLIQSVYELSDGSGLVVTVGKYVTPAGNDIDRYGIKPDFSSVPSPAQQDAAIRACKLAAAPALPIGAADNAGGGDSVFL